MRRYLIFAVLLAATALSVPQLRAQQTVVTATVKDPNGIPYAGGTVQAALQISGGPATVTINNQAQCSAASAGTAPCQIPIPGNVGPTTLDSTGTFVMTLYSNTSITPASSQWLFTINISPGIPLPLGTGPQQFSVAVTVTGATQNLSSTLSAAAPALTNFVGGGGSVSITGSSPIVVTPDPITGAGDISCPTCGVSSGTVMEVDTSTPLGGGPITTTGTLTCSTCATTTDGGVLSATTPIAISAAGVISCATCSTTTGTVTNIATTGPLGGGPITTTGTLTCSTCATTTDGGALSATTPIAISAAGVISCATCSTTTGTVTNIATTGPLGGGPITTTGTLTCSTCATTTNGGALSATAPIAISAAGVISCATCSTTTGTVTNIATTGPLGGGPITTTGTLTCSTCATTTNGGALSATSPVTISAAGVIACGTCSTTTGTVTSIATTGPITGGTITSTGTIACGTCGVTGSPLSQFASTTSAQLAGIISNPTGTGDLVFANTPTLVTPVIGAATGTSLLVTGNLDGTAPVIVTTGTTGSPGATFNHSYSFNEEGTAATGVTYTLPTAAAGKQYCIANSNNGTAPNTGVLTLATSASGQFIIFTDGTLTATGGNVTSGGAAADAACVVGVDSTHWFLYVQSGIWTKH